MENWEIVMQSKTAKQDGTYCECKMENRGLRWSYLESEMENRGEKE